VTLLLGVGLIYTEISLPKLFYTSDIKNLGFKGAL